jgi:hypothetical protein
MGLFKINLKIIFVCQLWLITSVASEAQVILRDTVINWQHHRFELNDDFSMKSFSSVDTDIQQVQFTSGKVIENDLIKLVLLPEYGGRVLSFVYKPTGHEYLYQSECGSAYGINENNFYYNWLMVYGGIFPTFPESEHGKTWLIPWDFSILKESDDTVTVRMAYQDSTEYSGAPNQFNNGITDITCTVDISVYKNNAVWDYEVSLQNNQPNSVKYEYWTCTTLAPGSTIGDTRTPLNSEIIIPVDNYFAGWSPGNWIGNFNGVYDLENINYLDKWDDMGIAYADDLQDVYWGVINHEVEEGIFRVSDNIETFGMKLWTWGKNNIDNNLFDFSIGGADNYIELWAGTSRSFFTDAELAASEEKSWKESYFATVGMTSVSNMNELAAINLSWSTEEQSLTYQLNTFRADEDYTIELLLDGNIDANLPDKQVSFEPLGHDQRISFADFGIPSGEHELTLNLYNLNNELVLSASSVIEISDVLGLNDELAKLDFNVQKTGTNQYFIEMPRFDDYELTLYNTNGQMLETKEFSSNSHTIEINYTGIVLFNVRSRSEIKTKKVLIR